MTRRSRIIAYGAAAALIVAGVLCAALITSGPGPLLAVGLVGLGLIAVISLVFLEVGLSEDRSRARTAEHERRASRRAASRTDRALSQRPLRPDRMRGRRRRLP